MDLLQQLHSTHEFRQLDKEVPTAASMLDILIIITANSSSTTNISPVMMSLTSMMSALHLTNLTCCLS
jgi:hypothetical protein